LTTVRLPIDVQATHSHTAEDEEEEEAGPKLVMPEELSCPICFKLMTDPVMAEDGQTYQRHAIEQWINKCIAGTVSAHGGRYRNSLGKCGMGCIITHVLTPPLPTASLSDGRGATGDVTTHRSRDGVVAAAQCTGQVAGARVA
jgi:hypothetical protein